MVTTIVTCRASLIVLRVRQLLLRGLGFLIPAGFLLFVQAAHASNYYVNGSTGNDNNNGSQSAPFKDFWPLMHVLKPGDTAYIASGTYTAGMYITVSGQPGKPITFAGASSLNLPVIKMTNGYPILLAPGVSYVNIKYFNVTTSNEHGIWAGQANHHIVIAYNVAHDCYGSGIGGWESDYISIHNNTVYNNAWLSNQDPSGINLLQLKNYDNASGFHNYIQSNVVYNNANRTNLAGKNYTTDGNGIILDDARHTLNTSIGPAYTGNTLIENNLVFNNGGRGIHIFSSDNVTIRNNVAYKNNWDQNNDDYHAGEIEAFSAGNVQVYNNIMYSAGAGMSEGAAAKHVAFSATGTSGVTVKADYNLTYGSTTYYTDNTSMNSWGSHNKSADPQFTAASTSPSTAKFSVKSTSPALGMSTTSNAPGVDILNVTRSGAITNGAYQYPVN